jgi:hypothetical protein
VVWAIVVVTPDPAWSAVAATVVVAWGAPTVTPASAASSLPNSAVTMLAT